MTEQLLLALHALYHGQDAQKKQEAAHWLEEYQKTSEAWITADRLLNAADSQLEQQMFAAQTIRNKVVRDLHQLVDPQAALSLRDSLLSLLKLKFSKGPRVIITQLCLALAGLALQVPNWERPVQTMMEQLGNQVDTHGILLEFLIVLPEEVRGNTRIPLMDANADFFHTRTRTLLTENAAVVLDFLLKLLQNSGADGELQQRVFRCFLSWLKSNDITIEHLVQQPLVSISFQALRSEELFDNAVDLICEIVRGCDDFNRAKPIIDQLLHHFSQCQDLVESSFEDEYEDRQKNVCRIFVEAAEMFLPMLEHEDVPGYRIIINLLLRCTAFPDLDVVPLTFDLWYSLAQMVQRPEKAALKAAYLDVFRQLLQTIVKHLRYPDDLDAMTAKDRDDFREFRHVMGDVLKDCCQIIGEEETLSTCLMKMQTLLSSSSTKWQDVEATLFALRAVGAEVSSTENVVMPQIMQILSQLPNHPKIRYAATLVIGRYSDWTREHPNYIQFQLQYISDGFNIPEVTAAAAMSLKFLCESCNVLMVDYLKDLHPFYEVLSGKLSNAEIYELTEAMAHIINSVPASQLTGALNQFCVPLAKRLHEILVNGNTNDENVLKEVDRVLGRINVFFKHIHPNIAPEDPHPCVQLLQEIWPIIDKIFTSFDSPEVGEALCRVLKNTVVSFGGHMRPVLPALISQTADAYKRTRHPCYMWLGSQIIRQTRREVLLSSGLAENTKTMVHEMVTVTFSMFDSHTKFNQMPDVVDDFFRLMYTCLSDLPELAYDAGLLPNLVQFTLAAMTATHPDILDASMRFLRDILSFACPPLSHQPDDNGLWRIGNQTLVPLMTNLLPTYFTTILQGLFGQGPSGVAFTGNLYSSIASQFLYLVDLLSWDLVAQNLMQQLNTIQVKGRPVADDVKHSLLNSFKNSHECAKPHSLRLSIATLSSLGRSKNAVPRRPLQL